MTQPPEPLGDYGYDMAHEDMAHEQATGSPAPRSGAGGEHHAPAPTRRDTDVQEDLGYDEAHDF